MEMLTIKNYNKMATIKKAKSGSAFGMLSVKAGIDKNPKPTAADRIAGAKGMAKSGKKIKKAQDGKSIGEQLAEKTKERNTPGTLLRQGQRDRLKRIAENNPERAMRVAGRMVKRAKANAPEMKKGGTVSMQLGSYKGTIGKNTKGKATKAVGLTKAKYGKSMGKCKNGC